MDFVKEDVTKLVISLVTEKVQLEYGGITVWESGEEYEDGIHHAGVMSTVRHYVPDGIYMRKDKL